MAIIRSAAGELPHVDLDDVFAVVSSREAEPHRFERAALRWLAALLVERREATLAEIQAAAWAFEHFANESAALDTLQRSAPGITARAVVNARAPIPCDARGTPRRP